MVPSGRMLVTRKPALRAASIARRRTWLSQYLPKSDVCVTSVQPPITDSRRTSRQVGWGPEVGYSIMLGKSGRCFTAIRCAWDWARRGRSQILGLFHLLCVFKNFKGQLPEDASKIMVLLTTCPGRQLQHALTANPQPLYIARSWHFEPDMSFDVIE